MKKETLEALEKSIEKWEKIVSGEGEDRGSNNCALCKLFIKKKCIGCPVYTKTKTPDCGGTPYEYWLHHQANNHLYDFLEFYIVKCPECKVLAQKELEFLKSLLPETQKTKKKEKKENEKRI